MFNKKIRGGSNSITSTEVIQVDFEGRNPSTEDFDGIKQLLSQLFLKAHINLNELTNIIIGQNYVGSVIKQCYDDMDDSSDDDDDGNIVLGITTAVNITNDHDLQSLKQIKNYLLEKAEKNATDTVLKYIKEELCGSKQVGFLINERFVNIPPQISLPLLENLQKELQAANNKSKPFDFSTFVLISKFYRKEDKQGKFVEDIFSNAEEEVFIKLSNVSFDFSVKDEADSGLDGYWTEDDLQLIPFRRVIIFNAEKSQSVISTIKELLQ